MRFYYLYACMLVVFVILTSACEKQDINADDLVPREVISKLYEMGFNPDGIRAVEDGYVIENDVLITPDFLEKGSTQHYFPEEEQYSTHNLVETGGQRTIKMYIKEIRYRKDGSTNRGFGPTYVKGLKIAMSRFNELGLDISFKLVTNAKEADISVVRLREFDELLGFIGYSGFPNDGNPHRKIRLSGIMDTEYGLDAESIASVIAHEMGHCIGFRHTDYFDRSISCGGVSFSEGEGRDGANHIPRTPTGADLQGNGSWMLSCTDGSDRPFTRSDVRALDYLY